MNLALIVAVSACMSGPARYAYATIHYEGTSNDDAYVLGVQTLLSSIKRNAHVSSNVDVLVLVSPSVSRHSRQLFRLQGATLVPIRNVQSPYKTKQRFAHTLNKLLLWKLTKYERIIYLDADCIVLRSMAVLFHAAHFGAVMLPNSYIHTGMLVLKPNATQFKLMKRKLHELLSYDGADQGFLVSMFNTATLQGPSFMPDKALSGAYTNLAANRFMVNFNVNALYWYERYSWNLLRNAHPLFLNMDVPAYSITYAINANLKPWVWYGSVLFEANHYWQAERQHVKSDAIKWRAEFRWRLFLLLLAWGCLGGFIRRRIKVPINLRKFGSQVSFSIVTGVVLWVFAIRLSIYCAPGLMPPREAYFLFLVAYPLVILWGLSALQSPGWSTLAALATLVAVSALLLGWHPFYNASSGVAPIMRIVTVLFVLQCNIFGVMALVYVNY